LFAQDGRGPGRGKQPTNAPVGWVWRRRRPMLSPGREAAEEAEKKTMRGPQARNIPFAHRPSSLIGFGPKAHVLAHAIQHESESTCGPGRRLRFFVFLFLQVSAGLRRRAEPSRPGRELKPPDARPPSPLLLPKSTGECEESFNSAAKPVYFFFAACLTRGGRFAVVAGCVQDDGRGRGW
jgi:hypothetical protein